MVWDDFFSPFYLSVSFPSHPSPRTPCAGVPILYVVPPTSSFKTNKKVFINILSWSFKYEFNNTSEFSYKIKFTSLNIFISLSCLTELYIYSISPGIVYISSTVKSYSIPNITNKVPCDWLTKLYYLWPTSHNLYTHQYWLRFNTTLHAGHEVLLEWGWSMLPLLKRKNRN